MLALSLDIKYKHHRGGRERLSLNAMSRQQMHVILLFSPISITTDCRPSRHLIV